MACLATSAPTRAGSNPPDIGDAALRDAGGQTTRLAALARANRLTVVVFYAAGCPCFRAHVERLQQLAADLGPRGVRFLLIDSERRAPGAPPPPPELAPGLPLLRDEGGLLARRLDARYATESFVLDPTGRVRYQGGLDSDRKYLRPDAQPYLRQAISKLLAGDAPAFTSSKALGCALRLM
ncbi:MAG TPA: redoxin domain-containing protein [Polyangia bacterium]|nr:redoxin domain-containing protein [Polyangia bacterium]